MGALLKRFSISRRKAAMHEQIDVSLIGRLVHDLIRLGLDSRGCATCTLLQTF